MHDHTKNFKIAIFVFFTFAAFLLHIVAFANPEDVKEFRKTVDLRSGGRLNLETYKGSVKLEAWNKEQVEIFARIVPGDNVSSGYAVESVEATRIDVYDSGSSVTIRSDYDGVPSERSWMFGNSRNLPYIHYEIKAPKNVKLKIDDHKSDLNVEGFEGRIIVETHKGMLDASKLSGEIILNTHKGEFTVTEISGNIEVNTHKGEITLEAVKLDGISRLETYKGNINLRVPSNLAFTVVADIGKRGDFDSDFKIERRRDWRHDDDDYFFEQDINGGGPEVLFKTSKGRIRIRN